MRATLLAPAIALGLWIGGCEADDWGPDKLAHGQTDRVHAQLERGREVYAIYCVGCHGEQGDGDGPAARFLDPKPRDFRRGRIKFASVESGEAPSAEDYASIIRHGLKGTAMPDFQLLPEDELDAVVAYVRSFYTEWADDGEGTQIALPPDPWADAPEDGISEGERLYHSTAKCWSCHPAFVEPDRIEAYLEDADLPLSGWPENMYVSDYKDSPWGAPIRATNFLIHRIKAGQDPRSLARTIATGIGGTAMPAWGQSLTPEQLWGLAWYVHDLARQRGTAEGRERTAALKEAQP